MHTNPMELTTLFGHEVFLPSGLQKVEALSWNPHPSFPGVFMKHLVTGKDTDFHHSSHLVRVDPYCALLAHRHPEHWEQHIVLDGAAHCRGGSVAQDYSIGSMRIIPQNEEHEVTATSDGVLLMAMFSPALC